MMRVVRYSYLRHADHSPRGVLASVVFFSTRLFRDFMNTFYLLGFQQAKRNTLSTQEKDIYLEYCNHAVLSATYGHFATEREDTQNIYII